MGILGAYFSSYFLSQEGREELTVSDTILLQTELEGRRGWVRGLVRERSRGVAAWPTIPRAGGKGEGDRQGQRARGAKETVTL